MDFLIFSFCKVFYRKFHSGVTISPRKTKIAAFLRAAGPETDINAWKQPDCAHAHVQTDKREYCSGSIAGSGSAVTSEPGYSPTHNGRRAATMKSYDRSGVLEPALLWDATEYGAAPSPLSKAARRQAESCDRFRMAFTFLCGAALLAVANLRGKSIALLSGQGSPHAIEKVLASQVR